MFQRLILTLSEDCISTHRMTCILPALLFQGQLAICTQIITSSWQSDMRRGFVLQCFSLLCELDKIHAVSRSVLLSRYEVMTSCWEMEPNERPDFSYLVGLLNDLLERDSGYLQLSCATSSMNTLTAAATPRPGEEMVAEINVKDGDLQCSTSFTEER